MTEGGSAQREYTQATAGPQTGRPGDAPVGNATQTGSPAGGRGRRGVVLLLLEPRVN